jgi:hypothetical protein
MQRLEVSCAVRHIYIYVVSLLRVKYVVIFSFQARFLNNARLKFKKYLYLHYISESINIT